jgi:hypothetical protein
VLATSLAWRHEDFRFSDGNIKAEMMLPSWNNFHRSLLHFVAVRSDHDEGLLRINMSLKPINGTELGRFRLVFFILR